MIPQKRCYGKGRIAHFSPPTLQTGAKMVNCYVNFVELLQIKAAIDDAVTHMNRNHRSTREGRDPLVNLCVHLDEKTLTLHPPYLDAASREPAGEKQHTETAHS